MARWGEDTVERVKQGNDIVETINGYVGLTRAGASYKACCPFHNEKTPSFMVSPARQSFHCFGCGVGGDVIHFVMKYEGLPFTEALRKLAARAGVELPEQGEGEKDEKAPLYRANRLAAEFYQLSLLRHAGGQKARDYLSQRGIHQEVCKAFGVGYAPPGWHTLEEGLRGEGVDPATLVAVGLAIPGEGGKRPHDRFRDRVVFPIRDLAGRVLGFGGRVMGDELPKYVNSPETAVYRKGDFLFGLDVAAPAVRAAGEVLLVEGYLDVIGLHQGGFGHAVGVLGTALTPEQARRLRRLAPRCVLLFDGDEAGIKAALRSGLLLLEEGMECRVTPLPQGEDPDSFVRKAGAEAMRKALAEGPPLLTFALAEARRRNPGPGVAERMRVLGAIRPFLARIRDKVELDLSVKEVAAALGADPAAVREELASSRRPGEEAPPAPRPSAAPSSGAPPAPIPEEEKRLVLVMLQRPETIPLLAGEMRPEDFSPGLRELASVLFAGEESVSAFLAREEALAGRISAWQSHAPPVEDAESDLRGCLRRVRLRAVRAEISREQRRLLELERGGGEREELDRAAERVRDLQRAEKDLKKAE